MADQPTSAPLPAPLPDLTPGSQSSELYLALLVLAAVFGALFAGKIDQGLAATLIGLIVTSYPALRTWLKARHVDTIAQVLAASHAVARNQAIATGLQEIGKIVAETPSVPSAQSSSSSSTLAGLAILGASLFFLTGCGDKLYYPNGHIAAVLMSDRTGESLSGGGMSYQAATALHSPVAREHWRGVSRITREAVRGAIGWKNAENAAVTGTESVADLFINRDTNRVPATPAPATPHALTAH